MKLYYQKAAREWTDALPIGNGRIGAMVHGGITTEKLQLNEDTLWSGAPSDGNNPRAKELLPEIRKLIKDGKYVEADAMGKEMMGNYSQSYLPFGDLTIHFSDHQQVEGYERQLDLQTAIASVEYELGDTKVKREVFTSFPDQVLVLHMSSSTPEQLTFSVELDSVLDTKTYVSGERMGLTGRSPERVHPNYYKVGEPLKYGEESIRFAGLLELKLEDGRQRIDEKGIHVNNATSVTLLFSAATSFNGFDKQPGSEGRAEKELALRYLERASAKTYEELRRAHIEDYQMLFQRCELDLGARKAPETMSTDQRIVDYGANDPKLVELLFQYGRYLLIASSRPGSQPANLQGIWNKELQAPWSSNYTVNINAEMNYWPAESANLSECHQPFLKFVEEIAVTGAETAEVNYGCRGWTAHHNSDLWRMANPSGGFGHGDPVWAIWPMSGAWLTQHLWEHYAFQKDENYLREIAYPVMKEAAIFLLRLAR